MQKSPADSAALPREARVTLVDHALPIWVVEGNAGLVDQLLEDLAVILRLPQRRSPGSGSAARKASPPRRRSPCIPPAAGGSGSADGRLSVCSAAMSSGSSRCNRAGPLFLGPGNASRTREGMLSASQLVGVLTRQHHADHIEIWKRPCLDFLIGFCPVIISIGMPPR